MNDAHLHIMVNHFPIIGIIFGIGILIVGMLLKNNSIKNTAYVVFIISAIFAALSVATGEGAEEIVEKLPMVTDEIVHEHHEHAEIFAIVAYITGLFSLISLYLSLKKNSFIKYTLILTLISALAAAFLSIETATTGGEMRHTEIRKDFVPAPSENHSDHEDHD